MRASRGILAALRVEVAAWRGDVGRLGYKHAILRRLRVHSGTEWLAASVDALGARVATLESDRLRVAEHDKAIRVATVMAWVAQATVLEDTLVSVVLPTRNRAAYLPRAVESILRQAYTNWELLIVDDASGDETAEIIAGLDDPRIRSFTGPGRSAGAARNVALAGAKGEVIAYVDDDNTMHPHWLKAVVWALDQRPDVDVVYGAFVVDDVLRLLGADHGTFPQLFLHAYDHALLARANLADMGAMAHRAGLAEGHFDEALREMADWDLLLRLTRERPPLVLPAVACFYTTDAPNRLSKGPTHEVDAERVRSRNRR